VTAVAFQPSSSRYCQTGESTLRRARNAAAKVAWLWPLIERRILAKDTRRGRPANRCAPALAGLFGKRDKYRAVLARPVAIAGTTPRLPDRSDITLTFH